MKQVVSIGVGVALVCLIGVFFFLFPHEGKTPTDEHPSPSGLVSDHGTLLDNETLCAMVERNEGEEASRALAAHTDISEVRCSDGRGALLHTALHSDAATVELVQSLIAAKADPCMMDEMAGYPIDIAQSQGNIFMSDFAGTGSSEAKTKAENFKKIHDYLATFECGFPR